MPSFSSLPGKRDSFGKYLSVASSLKDQLHTLMEEEEEEEESWENASGHRPKQVTTLMSVDSEYGNSSDKISLDSNGNISEKLVAAMPHTAPSPPTRHKPAHLTLRPLTLTTSSNANLPTPSSTPSTRPGLRTLTLNSSLDSVPSSLLGHLSRTPSDSLELTGSDSWRAHSPMGCAPSKSSTIPPKRQSSISYIRSNKDASPPQMITGLPTPGPTPTSERRQSLSSISPPTVGDRDRRGTSEEIFLHQSHAALLSRIRELEQLLRARSRPASLYSDESSVPAENNELLQLVADLKADRDSLNKDLSASRKRLEEVNERSTDLQRRLDSERREGESKTEQIRSLESEKISLQRQVHLKDQELGGVARDLEACQTRLHQTIELLSASRKEADNIRQRLRDVQSQLSAAKASEEEMMKFRDELQVERAYRDKLFSQLEASGLLRTPKVGVEGQSPGGCLKFTLPVRNNAFGFQSIDSACTSVDTESIKTLNTPFTLKAVEEEGGAAIVNFSDDDDALAHYEDEEDSDLGILSPSRTMSSCSDDDMSRSHPLSSETPVPSSNDIPLSSRSLSPSPFSSPCPTPLPPLPLDVSEAQHAKRASLSKTWTFPHGRAATNAPSREEVDRFFGCLEDIEDSPPELRQSDSASVFRQHLQFTDSEDDDLPPFILPTSNSMSDHPRLLDVVVEADEHEHSLDEAPSFDSVHNGASLVAEPFVPFSFSQRKCIQASLKNLPPIPDSPRNTTKFGASSNSPSLIPKSVSRLYQPSTPERAYVKPVSSTVSAASNILSPPSALKVPSPPTFVQAKTGQASKTPSPPRRKPAPIVTPASPFGLDSASVESNRSNTQARNGSTFIPKLKSPSRHTHSLIYE